jgi:5-carboxymethyl-2-hydroxymuconate isomerase
LRINGIVDSAKGPRVQVKVTVHSLNVSDLFWFLVDTGATYTQLSEADCLKLGIAKNKFVETNEEVYTAGEIMKQYVLAEKVRLALGDKNYDFEPMRVLIYQGNDYEKRKRFLENVLSIMGRDLIRLHAIRLTRNRITFD